MTKKQAGAHDSSWALQGCLIGAVGLFVILLIVMLFLGYSLFRENTQPEPAPSDLSAAPASPGPATGNNA